MAKGHIYHHKARDEMGCFKRGCLTIIVLSSSRSRFEAASPSSKASGAAQGRRASGPKNLRTKLARGQWA
jgi:hypothetical protein